MLFPPNCVHPCNATLHLRLAPQATERSTREAEAAMGKAEAIAVRRPSYRPAPDLSFTAWPKLRSMAADGLQR